MSPHAKSFSSYPSDLSLATMSTDSSDSVQAHNAPEEVQTKIRWGSVQVREYNRMVGDHPETAVGPPLTFGWEFNERQPISLQEYEEQRPKKKVYLRLSSITRKNLLKNVFGVPEKEIADSEKEIQKIKKMRESTIKQGKLGASVENAVQSAKRKMQRRFSRENLMKGISAASGSFMGLHAY